LLAFHLLEWPWDRPSTTVARDPRIPPPGHHDSGSFLSAPEARGTRKKSRPSTQGPQGRRIGDPGETVTARTGRVGGGAAHVKSWPWDVASTTVMAGIPKIAAPGEHMGHTGPNAVVLSELAATILQGFPESWFFAGKTKKARWSQIGQAMPPGLAEPVARAVVEQIRATDARREASGA
jgi:site-specific DNA-cytosine methylase